MRLHALGHTVGDQREFLGDDLPVDVDVGAPVELHVDHGDADARGTADGLDAGGAVECRFQRKGNQGLDFLGGHARHFGHHGDARAVQIGEYVDGQVIQLPAAITEHEQCRGDDEQPMVQRKTDNGIQHGVGVSLLNVDHSAFPLPN